MSNYKIGDKVKVSITGIMPYGIFVKTADNYIGLIHISEVSESFVKNINEYGKIGDSLYARIIDINDEEKKIRFSIKKISNKIEEKKRRQTIVETESGFKQLEENLNDWIKQKLEELDNLN